MKDSNENMQELNCQKKMIDKFPIDYLHDRFSYDYESGSLYWKSCFHKRRIGKKAGSIDYQYSDRGYYRLRVNLDGRQTFAHHIVWAMHYGVWPTDEGMLVDHINGDALDNRLHNLRLVNYAQNAQNMSLTSLSKTGVAGVTWVADRNKWRARIRVGGKKKSLGSFSVFEDAVEARKEAEKKYGFHENHGRS